jgi:uncharacterized protein YkwD
MPECEQCGREEMLPFTCAYCGGNYCVEHRLPENHNCAHRPKAPPPYLTVYDDRPPSKKPTVAEKPTMKRKQFSLKRLVALFTIVVITGVIIWSAYPSLIQLTQSPSVSPSPSTISPVPSTTPSHIPASPDATPSEFSHEELVNYALSLINSDRQSMGLQNVTLSSIDSGQRHAENMLKNNFFSHWDMNGYKPYMRYTLAGGKGAVAENCAAQLGFYSNIKEALKGMEWRMMYDDADSNWGHRDNILDPLHNRVSIGIAFDNNDVYLVQDFEDDYVSWSTLSLSNQVRMQGTILKAGESISQIAIYFDNPTSLTTQQLSNAPYQGGYDAGTYVGMVVSPPSPGWQYQQPDEGIMIIANEWSETGQNFLINFDMSTAFTQYGRGVYTLYLWTESSNHLTTLSIWN